MYLVIQFILLLVISLFFDTHVRSFDCLANKKGFCIVVMEQKLFPSVCISSTKLNYSDVLALKNTKGKKKEMWNWNGILTISHVCQFFMHIFKKKLDFSVAPNYMGIFDLFSSLSSMFLCSLLKFCVLNIIKSLKIQIKNMHVDPVLHTQTLFLFAQIV